ncbi:MAG: hypothetical protein LC734_02675 [Acidobacteria bacterium]|nr:hypothetical protein [Acidobacteriota bacterium]
MRGDTNDEPLMCKRKIILDDGRYMIFYEFGRPANSADIAVDAAQQNLGETHESKENS